MEKRGKYSKGFKIEALRLLSEGEKTGSELAMELGIKRTLLYRWRDQLEQKGNEAFNNLSGRPRKDQQSEIKLLQEKLKEVTEERDILKKAAAYFARDLK